MASPFRIITALLAVLLTLVGGMNVVEFCPCPDENHRGCETHCPLHAETGAMTAHHDHDANGHPVECVHPSIGLGEQFSAVDADVCVPQAPSVVPDACCLSDVLPPSGDIMFAPCGPPPLIYPLRAGGIGFVGPMLL